MTTARAKQIAVEQGVVLYYDRQLRMWVLYHEESNVMGTPAIYISSNELKGLGELQFDAYIHEARAKD